MRDFVWTWRGEWPKTSICPRVGLSKPSNSLTVVDLPEPFGPSRPNTSPRRTSKSTLSTARALGRFQKSLNTLVRPRTETTTSSDFRFPISDCGFGSVTGMANFNFIFRPTGAGLQPDQLCPIVFLQFQSWLCNPSRRLLETGCHSISKTKWRRRRQSACYHLQKPVTRQCGKHKPPRYRTSSRAHTKTHFAPNPRLTQPIPVLERRTNRQIEPEIHRADTKPRPV